ncbi:pentatricopeptide repeat-containing protein At4g14190, chloroplastic [Humulus lupulus]|uniref:pentatricopeptide repeat-containing protein At4g14190, chloroplastic n=1 Tax=Humulus lupulus TaxID=3486 RepID=UPI002B40A33F|nr:pentatricopeptide repeat-containing protein At4g14190, chloroplastic [Humulus lupulus]
MMMLILQTIPIPLLTAAAATRFSPTTTVHGFSTPNPSYSIKPKPFPVPCLSLSSATTSSTTQHTTLLVDTFHEHRILKNLIKKLSRTGSCPLQLLRQDGDWTKENFWAVVTSLRHQSRSMEILQVFGMWKNIEKSRINELNYNKTIRVLVEDGLMEEAVMLFDEMKRHGLSLSLETFNSIIHGFARKGCFDKALSYLDEMKEVNVAPESDTYDGLIEAYAKHEMYDEIGMCLKKMKLNDCPPDHITYNLLMREFSRAGLLKKMESIYHTMISKKMYLQSSTLIKMLEAYARFGILDKMDKFYTRVLIMKIPLEEDLIRKLAEIYINNYMFSKIETLGVDLSSVFGETELLWCLRLLSYACLLSRKGMDSVIQEMADANFPWNVTTVNIIMLTQLKMKDFTHLRISLSQLTYTVKPDIISIGILYDAISMSFDGTEVFKTWRRMGFLSEAVEMNTDPVVLTAFGKGHFLKSCEAVYASLEPEFREKKTWTYHNLIDLVSKTQRKLT